MSSSRASKGRARALASQALRGVATSLPNRLTLALSLRSCRNGTSEALPGDAQAGDQENGEANGTTKDSRKRSRSPELPRPPALPEQPHKDSRLVISDVHATSRSARSQCTTPRTHACPPLEQYHQLRLSCLGRCLAMSCDFRACDLCLRCPGTGVSGHTCTQAAQPSPQLSTLPAKTQQSKA